MSGSENGKALREGHVILRNALEGRDETVLLSFLFVYKTKSNYLLLFLFFVRYRKKDTSIASRIFFELVCQMGFLRRRM